MRVDAMVNSCKIDAGGGDTRDHLVSKGVHMSVFIGKVLEEVVSFCTVRLAVRVEGLLQHGRDGRAVR